MLKATRTPLINAEKCRQVLDLKQKLEGLSNPNTASDLECAGHLAKAGLLGCLANVKINVPNLKNKSQVDHIVKKVEKLILLD
jgi:formiminotetrahydrofolate cyclodeaminase